MIRLARHLLPTTTRRGLLLGLSAIAAAGDARLALAQSPGERRLVVIVLRGGLDGLFAAQPYADPHLAALRGPLALPEPGREGGLLDLGGRFGLHPALARIHQLYRANEALIVHAVAAQHRSRSHFEAQDLLEGGAERLQPDGWLNRALQAMPPQGRVAGGLAVGTAVPLLLRGSAPVSAYAPTGSDGPSPDLVHRIAALQDADPRLGPMFREGMRSRGFVAETLRDEQAAPERDGFVRLATAAGRLLAERDGPRVAVLELGGWDTHAQQAGRLQAPLRSLDAGIAALRGALAGAWSHSAVLVMTEFGRTARVNANLGTDHGTAGVAFVLGGAVQGGRVVADWPGLAPDALLEQRDLRPTMDLRAVTKALLLGHLRLAPAAVSRAFPGSDAVRPLDRMLAG